MPKNLRWKIPVVLALIAWSAYYTFPLKERIKLGLDLQGGMHLVLRVDTSGLPEVARKDASLRAVEIIRNRVDGSGIQNALIQPQGTDRILVQLPGATDRERALALLGRTALLEFKLAAEDPNLLQEALGGHIPDGYEISEEQGAPILLESKSLLTGSSLADARVDFGQYGEPVVDFTLNREGAQKFAQITATNIGRRLAIVLDGKVQSAPVIRSRIADRGQITGQFTHEQASDLAIVLRAGALPAPILLEEERTVGPMLGQDSIRSGSFACMVGTGLVVVFMIGYYLLAGLFAVVALALNLLLILGGLGSFHGTLTLPGIAGIVLTLGMAVDANVLINERIREELRTGKTLKQAVHLGYDRAFNAILDSNVTTLIAAALLFWFGSGPIKGFALTLTIGLLASMFTAIVVTRVLFDIWVGKGWLQHLRMAQLFGETKFDFIGKRRWFYIASTAISVLGLIVFFLHGERAYGIDFAGGLVQEYRFERPVAMDRIRGILAENGVGGASIQQFGDPRDVLIRTTGKTVAASGTTTVAENASTASRVETALQKLQVPFTRQRLEYVGPVVGKQLRWQALWATILALLGILAYVAVRFKQWDLGTAGVIALLHDVTVALGFLAFTGREFTLDQLAALLTIAGYSINDTIVTYDRLRENMRLSANKKLTLPELMNLSINQTLSRTILTTSTVILTVLALVLLGGKGLNDFSFCLLVGFISGAYSTVYIAGALVVTWRTKPPAAVAATAAVRRPG